MSAEHPAPTGGETGSAGSPPAASEISQASNEPMTAAAEVKTPRLAPEREATAPKPDANVEAPKIEAHKTEAPRPEATEAPRFPGKLMIMSPGDRSWDGDSAGTKTKAGAEEKTGTSGKRGVAAMAAVVVLATFAGAVGGALATAGLGYYRR